MKFTTFAKSLILGLAVLLASSAFAATKGSLHLQSAATINGTQLKPGDYKLEWDGSGPNVEVSILKGKNVVTKTQAKVVGLSSPALNDAAVVQKNDDGTSSITSVRFEGKKVALDLNSSNDGMQAGSSK
jgi:hypothetical protein